MIGLLISILFLTFSGEKNSKLDIYLGEKFSEYYKYQYEIVSLPSYVKSIDDVRISISSDRELKVNYGYAYVPIDIKQSGENISQTVITLKINLFDEVLVANRKINRGDVLSDKDFSVLEKEITHLRSGVIKDISEIKNHQAAMNIPEGAVLQNKMVAVLPDVNSGDKIFAYSEIGTVTVTFPVSARESGCIGETIRVVRDDRLTFKALIVDLNKVKIIE